MTQLVALVATLALAAAMAAPAAAQGPGGGQGAGATVETADVFDQGAEVVWTDDGAMLRRTPNGIQVRVKMPTPAPGTYTYPDPEDPETGAFASDPGHPEVFTLWVFVFNNPEDCVAGPHDCGMADLAHVIATGDNPAGLAVFGAAGHPVGGPNLTLAGAVSTRSQPFGPVELGFATLEHPADAEVHLAVAPHGGLDPQIMPEQAGTPAGTPDMWWTAVFASPDAD